MAQAQGPAAGGSIGRKALALRRAWTHYWTCRAARATVGILHTLDDRALKDIGLDRSEVESVAYGACGCWDGDVRAPGREHRVGMRC